MTNAEAAAHFAALDLDKPARVLLINGDTCTADTHDLNQTDPEDLADLDLDNEDQQELADWLQLPHVFLKW